MGVYLKSAHLNHRIAASPLWIQTVLPRDAPHGFVDGVDAPGRGESSKFGRVAHGLLYWIIYQILSPILRRLVDKIPLQGSARSMRERIREIIRQACA